MKKNTGDVTRTAVKMEKDLFRKICDHEGFVFMDDWFKIASVK